ncbi:MAG: NAD-dependent epimerase/dehydratase family protein [Kofleriaceae bacterium]|nr:NAD-dependent epimerase/dehydratase family protein [Kofleriaceae bacterium]
MVTLVTGGAGFIGSAVVRALLARGRAVRVLVEPGGDTRALAGLEVEQQVGSVLDAGAVARAVAGCDVVYHLAAIYRLWMPDDQVLYDVNVEGSRRVLGAAHRAGARRIIHTSSIAAIGWRADGGLADESTPFTGWRQGNAYVRSKYLSDRQAQDMAAAGAPIVIVCPAFPFGPRDLGPTPTGRLIVEALAGRVPGLPPGGFCAVDVDDVAACHLLAEERGALGERYIAGAHNVTYREFYQVLCRVAGLPPICRALPAAIVRAVGWAEEAVADRFGRPPRLTRQSADYATRRVWYDTRKARALGMPVTSLDQTVASAVAWFRDHGGVGPGPRKRA